MRLYDFEGSSILSRFSSLRFLVLIIPIICSIKVKSHESKQEKGSAEINKRRIKDSLKHSVSTIRTQAHNWRKAQQ